MEHAALPHAEASPPEGFTTWHITWGTYGTRLHGDPRMTVDLEHNQRGDPYLGVNARRETFERKQMKGEGVILSLDQRQFIEATMPDLCTRGGWMYRIVAAPNEGDHIHVLIDVPKAVHGEYVRRLLKRWLTQALNKRFERPSNFVRWWAVQGSNKAVRDASYRKNAYRYIERQRTTRVTQRG